MVVSVLPRAGQPMLLPAFGLRYRQMRRGVTIRRP